MSTQLAMKPRHDLTWFREQSTLAGVIIAGVGAAALAVVVGGGLGTLIARGITPLDSIVATLRSGALRTVLQAGTLLGLVAVVAGIALYRRMPTKLARDEAVAGAVLGGQALALGAIGLWFLRGDVELFARNVLKFELIGPQVGAFLNGAKNTVLLAATGEAIGIVLGLFLALFVISSRAVVRAPARVYINFFRGTPLLWQLSFAYFGVTVGFGLDISTYTAGIAVFGLNTAAYAAEVFRAGIQSVERGQIEAARGLGMSYGQAMRFAIVPQAVRRVIPPLMNEFVILIKDTSLIIFLGLTQAQYDLMSVGTQGFADSFNATFYVATAAGYLLVSLPLIGIVNAVERRLRSGLIGVTGA